MYSAQILAGLHHKLRTGVKVQRYGNVMGGMELSLALSGAVLKMQFTEGQVATKPDLSDFALR